MRTLGQSCGSLFCSIILAILTPSCSTHREEFRSRLSSSLANAVSLSPEAEKVATIVNLNDNGWPMRCSISPSGRFVAISSIDGSAAQNSRLQIISIDTRRIIFEIHPVISNGIAIVPAELLWGPEDSEAMVYMKFHNHNYGIYCELNLQTGDLTIEAKAQVNQMFEYANSDFIYSENKIGRPAWDFRGVRYSSTWEADQAGVKKFYERPSFNGLSRTHIYIGDAQFEVLIGENDENGQSFAYFINNGRFVDQIKLATHSLPVGALIYYDHDDLLLLKTRRSEDGKIHAWKMKFPHEKFYNLLVTNPMKRQTAILITRADGRYTAYLISI